MNIILILLSLICAYKIYSTSGETRYNWFIGSMLFLYSSIVILEHPHFGSHRLFVVAFLFSLIKKKDIQWSCLKKNPLFPCLVVYLIVLIIINYNSPFLSPFYKIYKPVIRFVDTYMIILLGYYGVNNTNIANKRLADLLIIVTLYGLFTFFTSTDPYRLIMGDEKDYYADYFFGDRRRVAATWSHPIAYGLICTFFFYTYLSYGIIKNKILVLFLLVASVFLCGSRSALFVWLYIGSIIMFFVVSRKKTIIFLLLFAPIALCLPPIQNKISDVIASIQGSDTTAGSSMDMRGRQLAASLGVAAQFPITGGGLDYIQEQMNFGTDEWVDEDGFYGFESYFYELVIERGAVGVLLESFIVFAITVLFWRRHKNKVPRYLGLGFLWGFVIFAFITGPLNTWTISMFFIGVMLNYSYNGYDNFLKKLNKFHCNE